MAKKTYKKRNYLKSLPKVGGTVAMTVAMAAALAVPAQATELEGEILNQDPATPVVEAPAETPAPAPAPAPASLEASTPVASAALAPVDTSTPDTTPVTFELPGTNAAVEQENNEIIADNQEIIEDNQEIIHSNENTAAENEANTNGELPAPDLTIPDAPEAPNTDGLDAEDYNDAVENYEDQADAYDKAVDEYNQDIEDYNTQADAYDKKAEEDYQKELTEHNQAVTDRENEQKYYDDVTLPEWQQNDAAYQQYLKDLDTFDAYEKEYNEVLLPTYEADGGKAHEATLIAFENYKNAVEQWKADYEAYKEQYAEDNEKARQDAWDKYVQGFKEIYDEAVKKEMEIYQNVDAYNKEIEAENVDISKKNEDLKSDINSNFAEHLGDAINNENVEISDEIRQTLGGYQALLDSQKNLEEAAAALDAHSGKDAKLDTPEYAAYLKAVEDYNKLVAEHNGNVDQYNAAIEEYNKAVEEYNLAQEAEEDIFVDTSNSTGTADWGNITLSDYAYFNHIDVKYAAAVSQDKLVDENGNPITDGKDSYSKYTVTGVYTSESAAKTNPGQNGVSYRNDSNGPTQFHYIESLPEHHEFGHPNHTGAWLDPEKGEISFYVEMVNSEDARDEEGNLKTIGITVNMDASSVYPEGTYYKAIGTDKLSSFRYGENNSLSLPTVTIDKETYYDISGQSVFVISALTCDGMGWGWNHNGLTLNPNGLDLVLNMQTLIEIHKAGNAQKLGYVNLEYGKTAQNEEPKYDEYEGNPEGFQYTDLDFTPPAPPKPGEPDYVKNPGERPTRPEDYTEKAPEAPKSTGRLELLNKLESNLFDKVIVTWTPEDPTPVNPTPGTPQPRITTDYYFDVNDYVVEPGNRTIILDEEVPLADAPLTGDISGLWAAISSFSLGAMAFLGRKRKDEDA